jgi:hypothetical protein
MLAFKIVAHMRLHTKEKHGVNLCLFSQEAAMWKKTFALMFAITLSALTASAHGGKGGQGQLNANSIMPLSEVKPGQVAVVRTVFQGTKIEEFECEVIGVLSSSIGPRKDMILVKLRGQKPEFTGVVAGMSGSPVYINGRLVGALAYRWGIFTKEPIAGVTPIEYMLEVAGYDRTEPQRRSSNFSNWNYDLVASALDQPANGLTVAEVSAAPMMIPIATPLVFSGFDRRVFDHFAELFRRNNFVPMMGGASSGEAKQDSDFEPGAALACVLMSGDMSIAATGTLTYRDGERVLGFGHPMFQVGAADFPMAKANVLVTLSSSLASFKIAKPTEIVGAIRQDRLTAIAGQIGARAQMIPVSVEVNTARGQTRSYSFQVFEEPFFTPLLLNIALANSMIGTEDYSSVQTISLIGKIEIEGHPSVNISDMISSDDADIIFPSAFRVSGQIARIFSVLYTNSIERPRIRGISLHVDQAAERRGAMIEEVWADREEVRPGEEFTIAVVLRPYRGERVTKLIKLKAPQAVERGQEMRVLVCDAPSFEAAEGRMRSIGGSFTLAGSVGQAASLDDLIEQLNRMPPSNAIYVRVSQNAPGALINQKSLPSLPLSVRAVIGSNQTATNTITIADSALLTEVEPVSYPVAGRRTIKLMVK